MDKIKIILEEYEMVIVNLSEDKELKKNLKKFDDIKKLLSKPVIERMVKVKNYQSSFIKMLNHLFDFDDEMVFDTFKYI